MTTEIFKSARSLYVAGLAIHWLREKSKVPFESGWTTGPRKEWLHLKSTYREGMNVGVRLGTPSKLEDGFLAVVDIDIKSEDPRHRKEALKAAANIVSQKSAPVVVSGRGNGSRHIYIRTASPFKTFNPAASEEFVEVHMPSKKPSKLELERLSEEKINSGIRISRAWEVSLYSDGRQVVLPPSIHPDTGKEYSWKVPFEVENLPLVDVSALAPTPKEKVVGLESAPISKTDMAELDFEPQDVELEWVPISDKIREGILNGTDVNDRSGFLLPAANALISAGLNQNEVLSVLTNPSTFLGACAYDHAKTKNRKRAAEWIFKYTFKKIAHERSPQRIFAGAIDVPVRKLEEHEIEEFESDLLDGEWRRKLNKNGKGQTTVTLKNLDLIFTNSVDGDPFVKDLFANRIIYGADTPWGGKNDANLEDIDLVLVKRWLADTEFRIEPSTNAILEATSLVAHRMAVHPVRDWLSNLVWDGTPRLNTWLKDYCEAEAAEPYLSEVSRKFLLAMVKRIFEPGCQWDYVLVLEGKQGKYKSSIARAIAGDKWFMDNLPDLKDKDAMLNLQGKWLIELAELSNVKRADYNLVKAYLIRRTDTVRPHYGRLMADVPRQSVFIGTVNEGQYLKDPTGNRRFWPVLVHNCDVPGLKAVRDQLFAEALFVYKETNEILMLSPEATAQAEEAQEDRRVDDDETEMRESFIAFRESEAGRKFDWDRFKTHDLFTGVDAPWGRWGGKPYSAQTAGQILRNMGFSRRKLKGQRVWGNPENDGARPGTWGRGHGEASTKPMPPFIDDEIDFM